MTALKEAFYDEKISPLMTQIIALCKEAKINMVADFSLGHDEEVDSTMYCTTCMPDLDKEDEKGMAKMMRIRAIMYPQVELVAFTVSSVK